MQHPLSPGSTLHTTQHYKTSCTECHVVCVDFTCKVSPSPGVTQWCHPAPLSMRLYSHSPMATVNHASPSPPVHATVQPLQQRMKRIVPIVWVASRYLPPATPSTTAITTAITTVTTSTWLHCQGNPIANPTANTTANIAAATTASAAACCAALLQQPPLLPLLQVSVVQLGEGGREQRVRRPDKPGNRTDTGGQRGETCVLILTLTLTNAQVKLKPQR